MIQTIAQSVGTAVESGMTALEAVIQHRNMDWETKFLPVYYRDALAESEDDEFTVIESKKAVLRDDTKACLGIVGQGFQDISNRLSFSIADDIDGDIVGCGEYEGGRTSWMQLKLNKGSLPILGDDVIDQYVLIVTGHAGNSKLMYILTPIRVVCKNTLMYAIKGRKAENSGFIRHSGDVQGKVKFANTLLTKAGVFFADTQKRFQQFAGTQLTQPTVETYFKEVEQVDRGNAAHFVRNEETGKLTDILKGRKRNMFDSYMSAYHGKELGADLPGVKGTAWGAYNAVTQVQDHDLVEEKRKNVGSKSANDRAAHQLFEGGPLVKQRAFDLAMDLVLANN